jgi:hypothetical protein
MRRTSGKAGIRLWEKLLRGLCESFGFCVKRIELLAACEKVVGFTHKMHKVLNGLYTGILNDLYLVVVGFAQIPHRTIITTSTFLRIKERI